MKKILFIIIDGLGDRPIRELGNMTPLEAARTPNLDNLAVLSQCGLMSALGSERYPTSDEAQIAIFGYNPLTDYPGRGPIEALGIGTKLSSSEVAIRIDFGTVSDNLTIIDRRAGRIDSVVELAKAVSGIKIGGIKFFVYPGLGHRAVLVLKGKKISGKIGDSDPHKVGVKVRKIIATDNSEEAAKTATALEEYLLKSYEILKKHPINLERIKNRMLPANFLLERGAGTYFKVPSFKEKFGLSSACIAGAPLYKGIGQFLGMEIISVPGANGLVTSNLRGKFEKAVELLKSGEKRFLGRRNFDFVFLHIKATDTLGEDGNWQAKKDFIEKIDKAFTGINFLKNFIIVVTADHSTPCELKDHSKDPVPIMIYDGINRDYIKTFGERDFAAGTFKQIRGQDIMDMVMIKAKS